ncbi:peptidoglycan binding domain-containing protein [Microbacterium sp. gxy059]|uniref:peptidoglycan binding domain-containing protein n=1 Tax=Microbacterium sp. gxy059 TaxID=2957199 RepID=UPI003D9699A6
MTDLATPSEETETTALDAQAPADGAPADEAEGQKKPRRSRKGLWLGIGIPSGLVVAGGIAASLILIAPGVTVLGASVGLRTPGVATTDIAQHLRDAEITLTLDGASATLTGDDLGLELDAKAAAEAAFDAHPLWNIGAWNPAPLDAELSVDEGSAAAALAELGSESITEPVNAQIEFSDGAYEVVPDEVGTGVDTTELAARIQEALAEGPTSQALASGETLLAAGSSSITVEVPLVERRAVFTTEDAEEAASRLDATVQGVSFALDEKEVAHPDAATVASWITPAVGDDGEMSVEVDEQKVQEFADGLPEQIGQEVVDGEVIVDGGGNVLKTVTEGQDGYRVASVDGVGAQIAEAIRAGDAPEIALEGEVVEHEMTERFRRAVVDLSGGHSYFYESVDGGEEKLVESFPMAIGKPGYDTVPGEYTVYGQLTTQNMGSCDENGEYDPERGGRDFGYCTANVPWITYFNGDQGFHGTYWHGNFGPGARMSHGCVNLTEGAAEFVYYFLQVGSPVSVRA